MTTVEQYGDSMNVEDDGVPFAAVMARLEGQFAESAALDISIRDSMRRLCDV